MSITLLELENPPTNISEASENEKDVYLDLVVFTVTFYQSKSELRCQQAYRTLQLMIENNIPIVVVDDSPQESGVFDFFSSLSDSDHNNLLHLFRQQVSGKKGAALREAAMHASQLKGVTTQTWLGWQEAEKSDMANHWNKIINSASRNSNPTTADIIVCSRTEKSFRDTYPIEQYHSEMFGSYYLNSVAHQYYNNNRNNKIKNQDLYEIPKYVDWLFGPFAFRIEYLYLWTSYDGSMYDAQLVPIVHGLQKGLKMLSIPVDFQASKEMKEQEEMNIKFIEKRFNQLQFVNQVMKEAWEFPQTQ